MPGLLDQMYPPANGAIPQMAPQQTVPQVAPQQAMPQSGGLLGALRQPGVSNGLLALASGLLEANGGGLSFGQGLSKGLMGFNQQLQLSKQQAMQQEMQKLREKQINQQISAQQSQQMAADQERQAAIAEQERRVKIAESLGLPAEFQDFAPEIAMQKFKPGPTPEIKGSEALGFFQIDPVTGESRQVVQGLGRQKQYRAPITSQGEDGRPVYVDPTTGETLRGPGGRPLRPTDTRKDNSFTQANQLRTQINTLTKPYREVVQGFDKVQAGLDEGTGAGDAAAIFAYAKVLDPASVVRETEFATLENVGGTVGRLAQLYNRVRTGERLPPDIREQIRNAARSQLKAYKPQYDQIINSYGDIADRAGLNRDDVLPNIIFPELNQPQPGPAMTDAPINPADVGDMPFADVPDLDILNGWD